MESPFSAGNGSVFVRAFEGRLPLWKVFWLGFVPAPLILYVLYLVLLWTWAMFMPMVHVTSIVLPFGTLALAAMTCLGLVVWRCSWNAGKSIWGYSARLVVVAYLLWYGLRILSLWWVAGV